MDKSKHISQGLTQRLIDLGVIVFYEIIQDGDHVCECYHIYDDFIMTCNDLELDTEAVYVFMEAYNHEGEFELFKASSWEEDYVDITKDNIEVYKKINV